ncbi:MAG: recombination regulator RecX [Candidatus Thiodiazotropha sp. (ex Dulcina madagascariensis)]|nr:recombination regulator RecX [Candidatus Thiodiazotropha sp. (ex Dulcina madagascariensis)]
MLTAREHSLEELRNKLQSRGFDEQTIDAVLQRLSDSGLQSDDRFAENFVTGRVSKGSGPVRIRAELRERGVDEALIETHLAGYAGAWPELLLQVHDAKYGKQRAKDRKELAKRARFLEYRGFPGELIRDFLFD